TVAIGHAGFYLRKNDFRDVGARNRARSIGADRFAKIATIQKRNGLPKNHPAFGRALPGGESFPGLEIDNDGPRNLRFANGWWYHVGADESGKVGNCDGMPGLPCGESLLGARVDLGSRYYDSGFVPPAWAFPCSKCEPPADVIVADSRSQPRVNQPSEA